jgi:catechol 2,3-dioxygenase-like lactoylglutathione lyase family enzyme
MTLRAAVASLGVRDIARSVAFYRSHFGFEVMEKYEPDGLMVWCRLKSGAAELMLQQLDDTQLSALPSGGAASWVLYLNPTDIQGCLASFAHSAYAVSELSATDYGTQEFYVADPDGYEIWVSASA